MTLITHTKGPLGHAGTAGHEIHGQSAVYSEETGKTIAIVYDGRSNASLLARFDEVPHDCDDPACPGAVNKRKLEAFEGLLEAAQLRRNTRIHDNQDFEGDWVAIPHEDFMSLRNAIAKAEGMTP